MEIPTNLFQDPHISSSYMELLVHNLQRGNLPPEAIPGVDESLRSIADWHPTYWLTARRQINALTFPIYIGSAALVLMRTGPELYIPRIDTEDVVVIHKHRNPATISVRPLFFGYNRAEHEAL